MSVRNRKKKKTSQPVKTVKPKKTEEVVDDESEEEEDEEIIRKARKNPEAVKMQDENECLVEELAQKKRMKILRAEKFNVDHPVIGFFLKCGGGCCIWGSACTCCVVIFITVLVLAGLVITFMVRSGKNK